MEVYDLHYAAPELLQVDLNAVSILIVCCWLGDVVNAEASWLKLAGLERIAGETSCRLGNVICRGACMPGALPVPQLHVRCMPQACCKPGCGLDCPVCGKFRQTSMLQEEEIVAREATDLWAVGAMAFEILCGRSLYPPSLGEHEITGALLM